MLRLFYLMIGAIFAFMLWRIIRIVARSGRIDGGTGGAVSPRHDEPADASLKNAQEAKFEDLQPPPKDTSNRAPTP